MENNLLPESIMYLLLEMENNHSSLYLKKKDYISILLKKKIRK